MMANYIAMEDKAPQPLLDVDGKLHNFTLRIAGKPYRCLYVEAKPYARGAFPATYAREAYGDDRYEAQAPNARVSE
jgi:hypothetical protein